MECKIGDGTGGTESNTGKLVKTYQECITLVIKDYPDANGATIQTSCTDSCKCFAEFGMTGWLTNDYSVGNYRSYSFYLGKNVLFFNILNLSKESIL